MGQTLFGGSSGSQSSSNQAYPYLQGALSPGVASGQSATSQLANMLGLNGPAGQQQGFNNWQNSTGYQFGLDQGSKAITGNAAASGLLDSGSTAKALDTYGQNYANTQYQNYLNPLENLMSSGLTGAGIIGGAGNVSSGQNSSSPGIGKFIGQMIGKGGGS